MSTVALEKIASDVAKGVTPHYAARHIHELRHPPWRDWIDANFTCFAKIIIWIPSWFAKLLEVLLIW
jgi:hypothetical protein